MMMQSTVILYGNSAKKNIESAYEMAVEHMARDSDIDIDVIKKHVFAKTYPNLMVIDGKTEEIAIGQTRGMIEFLAQKPTLKGKKAVVIENSHNMNRNAANSILKCLEDSALDDMIILTTNNLSSILPTIRSRCLKIRVSCQNIFSMDYVDVNNYIVANLFNIDIEIKSETILKISNFASSQMRKSYSSIINFVKQLNPTEIACVPEILLAYSAYQLMDGKSGRHARAFLHLQKMTALAQNTHPDPQYLAIACFVIL